MPKMPPYLSKPIERALRLWRSRRIRLAVWAGASLLGLCVLAAQIILAGLPSPFDPTTPLVASTHPFGFDAWSYYHAGAGAAAYAGTATTAGLGPWRYAPLWLPILAPLQNLSFPAFAYVVSGVEALALLYLTRRWFFASFLFLPVFIELYEGNIYLLSAALIVFALRHSGGRRAAGAGGYAVLAFTKVSPFAVVAYHAFRREWRPLAVACATVAVLLAAGYLTDPTTWSAWINSVASTRAAPDYAPAGLSLEMRAPLVLLLLLAAAWRRWPALVIGAAFLALPAIWWHSYSMLIAIPAASASLPPRNGSRRLRTETADASLPHSSGLLPPRTGPLRQQSPAQNALSSGAAAGQAGSGEIMSGTCARRGDAVSLGHGRKQPPPHPRIFQGQLPPVPALRQGGEGAVPGHRRDAREGE
jgi:hypothetical protein